MKKSSRKAWVLKELEQEKLFLEEINQYLSENENISNDIFDSMSHELRTPTVTIKSYTDMLLKGKFGKLTKVQHEKLEKIETNTDLLIGVIFQMLDKSKKPGPLCRRISGLRTRGPTRSRPGLCLAWLGLRPSRFGRNRKSHRRISASVGT